MKRVFAKSLVLTLLAALAFGSAGEAQLTKQGRWLQYDGASPYFVGFDAQQLAADSSINYTSKLDALRRYGVNKVRIWIYPYFGGSGYLQPWVYSSGKFALATGVVDANWNSTYWSRVSSFVAAARARDILVEVTIFAPNNLGRYSDWSNTTFKTVWNRDFNTTSPNNFSSNGSNNNNTNGSFIPEFFTLGYTQGAGTTSLQVYQEALVDKTLAVLGTYDNVFFEIANEYPLEDAAAASATATGIVDWHKHFLHRVADGTGQLVTAHTQQGWGPNTTGIGNYWDDSKVDILNFHFQSYQPNHVEVTQDPDGVSSLLHAAQTHGKVLTLNESGDYLLTGSPSTTRLNNNSRMGWGMLLSGGYFSFYQDDSGSIGDSAWTAPALRLQAMRAVAETAGFAQMSPVNGSTEYDSLVSGGPGSGGSQVMADPGERYLAYFWGTPTTAAASINLSAGTYQYSWHDARNATMIGCGDVSGGGVRSIPAPSTSAWDGNVGVALIVRSVVGSGGGHLSACVTTSPASVNLEAEGWDWAHWGLTTDTSYDDRAVSRTLSNYTPIGGASATRFDDAQVAFSWTGGQPTATASNSTTGVAIRGVGNGFRLTLSAGNTVGVKTMRLYVGAWNGRGRLRAYLSDGSAPELVDLSVNSDAGGDDQVYTIQYFAPTRNQTLTVEWTVEYDVTGTGGVTLEAASLI